MAHMNAAGRLSSIALLFNDRTSLLRSHDTAAKPRDVLDVGGILDDDPEPLKAIGHMELDRSASPEKMPPQRPQKPKTSVLKRPVSSAAEARRRETPRVRIRTKRKPEILKLDTWTRYTPSDTSDDLCVARTWNRGKGGQCTHQKKSGDFCSLHAGDSWKLHGRVDGPITASKLKHFLAGHRDGSQKQRGVSRYVEVQGDGWGSGTGSYVALVVEARPSSYIVAPILGPDQVLPEKLALHRHCTFISSLHPYLSSVRQSCRGGAK